MCLLIKKSWNVCERRHREGFPALSVFWRENEHKNVNIIHCLKALRRIITTKMNSPIVLVTEEDEAEEEVHNGMYYFQGLVNFHYIHEK